MPSASRDCTIERAISADLVDVHAGHRLVEQQQVRLGADRARHLDALAHAVGERAHRRLEDLGQAPQGGDAVDDALLLGELLARARQPEAAGEEARPREPMTAEQEVLAHARGGRQREVLERAADPQRGDLRRPPRREVVVAVCHAAGARAVDAGEHIEKRRLACAVGSDDRVRRAGLDAKRDGAERLEAAEAHRDVLHRQRLRVALARRHALDRLGGDRLDVPLAGDAEVALAHLVAGGELRGVAGERDLAHLEHHRTVADLQRHRRVLLDQHDRRALFVDLLDDLADLVDELRGEAQRGLVEQQQLRVAH